MSASAIAVTAEAAQDFSRLRVPDERQLAQDVRDLVQRHDGDSWVRAQRIALDHHLVPLSKRERALVEFALRVTRTPKAITPTDFEALRAAGLDEQESLEALETIFWFNHTNRIFISLGVVPDAKYFQAG